MIDGLYNSDILSLASRLRNERLTAPCASVRKVSKLCGSELELDINMQDGCVTEAAVRVQACALGQASAAILMERIEGASLPEIQEARDSLYAMLKSDGPAPTGRFERLSLLAGVAKYPARHTSTLLAFDAALEAAQTCIDNV